MKKITRIAALLAAGALLFGAVGCSSGGGSDEEGTGQNGGNGGGNGGGSGGGGGSEGDDKTSTWEFSDLQGVAADIKVVSAEVAAGTVADAAAIAAVTTDSLTAFPTHSASGNSLDKFYILEDVEYPATEGDKTMTILAKADGTNYNFHNKYYGLYTASGITVDHSKGTLEIKGDALSIADVQGPFSVTVVSTVNGSSDKNDRYAYIKTGTTLADAIAAQPVKKAEASKASGDTLTYTYDGTDKLTVIIGAGGSGSIRVFDVKVTEDESAGGDQQGGGDNSGNTGDSGNTGSGNENQGGGDNSGNTGNTGNGNENQGGGNNESGDQGGEGGGEDGGEEEEPEADYSIYTEDFASVDFTTLSENKSFIAAAATAPVQIESTDFYAISGASGKVITLEKKGSIMSLCTNGTGGEGLNAVYFTAKKGKALVTVSYQNGNTGRYVKVCNAGMDTATPSDSLLTSGTGASNVKTRNIEIEVADNDTKIYLGSASNGIYITAISVKYQAEE